MRVITYLAFTLLSIVFQLCVMDFIQEKVQNDNKIVDLNVTSHKKQVDILKEFNHKPHGLYYRTNYAESPLKQIYGNLSLPATSLETTTVISSTLFDLLYDENTSVTEDVLTTESIYTTMELDNVTEIILFNNKNKTSIKPTNLIPKRNVEQDCNCNFLHKVCDINCCCDSECTETERNLFKCNEDNHKDQSGNYCYSQDLIFSKGKASDSYLCIVKINLPDKRKNNNYDTNKINAYIANKYFKWHSNNRMANVEQFTRKSYKNGDPLWVLKNDSLYYIDLPSAAVNNYCTGRKPLFFFKNEKITCIVKLTDLEVFHILNNLDETRLLSATEKSINSSTLNCSTLHCTNWSITVCNEDTCENFNKSLHDPLCTEAACKHLAVRVDYIFYYYESKIISATVKLYTQKVFLNIPYISQEINIMFYMANKSIDQILELSGSPGYINSLPVIMSFDSENYTENFFGTTAKKTKHLSLPINKNGICALPNMMEDFVSFGVNKRIKCRYYEVLNTINNHTVACNSIQNNINQLIGLNKKFVVSPFGNPHGLKDEDWIIPQIENTASIIGEFNTQKTELLCFNLITHFSLIFTFADVSEIATKQNKILSAKIETIMRNVTFNLDEISVIISFDSIFIDVTKPSVYEYARGPHLNIHLPQDFFFPFPSNQSYKYKCGVYIILVSVAAFFFH